MKIFEFDDYRDYLKQYFLSLPRKGYGKLAELAAFCEMNPATLTLVIQKERDFTLDQANDVCQFLALSDFEVEFFFTSVQMQRAVKNHLRTRLKNKLKELKSKSHEVKERLSKSKTLDENAKAQFYSEWFYSAVRISTAIEGINNIDAISKHLQLPRQTTQKVVDFLLGHGLLTQKENKLSTGIQTTHVSSDSLLVNRHHTNWRLRGIQNMGKTKQDEMFFTSPVALSKKDIQTVREILLKSLEDAFKVIDPSDSEELMCLNIDWFRI